MTGPRTQLWDWIKTHAVDDVDAKRAIALVKAVIADAPRAHVTATLKRLGPDPNNRYVKE